MRRGVIGTYIPSLLNASNNLPRRQLLSTLVTSFQVNTILPSIGQADVEEEERSLREERIQEIGKDMMEKGRHAMWM